MTAQFAIAGPIAAQGCGIEGRVGVGLKALPARKPIRHGTKARPFRQRLDQG